TNSSTTNTIAFGGTAAVTVGLGTVAIASTGASTSTTNNAITSGDFTVNAFNVTDLTVNVNSGGALAVATGNLDQAGLIAAINTAAGSTIAADNGSGGITVTGPTGGVVFGGANATTLGIGTVAAAATDNNITSADFTVAAFNVTGLTVDLGAGGGVQTVTNGLYDAAGLISAINAAAGTSIAATDGSGGITVTNSTTNAFTFAGANATTLGIGTVAAATPGSVTNTTAASTGVTAAVATINPPSGSVTVDATNTFTIQLGSATAVNVANGTYTTPQALVDAMNTAMAGNASASANTNGSISINSGEAITIGGTTGLTTLGFTASNPVSGSLTGADVLNVANSNTMMQRIDSALTAVSTQRSTFGAIQNRFESVITNLSATTENLTAARSRIQDTDFAAETAQLTRNQILQQAGVAMLAQANALPNNVLTLLRG
ncbi:MAG: flagellin, partial [Kiritimatiellota bacterium]|nr:flagellin [Kiritimatiellota bacterium]